jgi:anti-anti-sigma factor
MAAAGTERQDLLIVRLLGDSRSRVIGLEGEVDLSTIASLVEALDIAIADHPEVLLIDVRNLSFLDLTGLRSLLDAQEACRAIDCRFLLTRGSRPVERLMQIARVDGLFEFVSGVWSIHPRPRATEPYLSERPTRDGRLLRGESPRLP